MYRLQDKQAATPQTILKYPVLRTLLTAIGGGAAAAGASNLLYRNAQRETEGNAAFDAGQDVAYLQNLNAEYLPGPGFTAGAAGLSAAGGAAWTYPRRFALKGTLQASNPTARYAGLISKIAPMTLGIGVGASGGLLGYILGNCATSNGNDVRKELIKKRKLTALAGVSLASDKKLNYLERHGDPVMDKNAERVSVALIKLAEIGAAVVAQQEQAEQFEKRAYMVPLLAGVGTGIYTRRQMHNDADLQSKLDALEQQPGLSADDEIVLNALLDRHRHSNAGLASAAVTAGLLGPAGAVAGMHMARGLHGVGLPPGGAAAAALGGALAGTIGGAAFGGLGGWAGKRISAATSPEARRARALLKNYNAE